ncbi:MAG TPA: GNAT family N-acetyltransferase [Thermoplasmata archaeon]|nr:GNAT family N-acetyltransferase [Thermoplasmata archaeon]
MSDPDFEASRARAIPRHAADQVRRGLWTEKDAEAASRAEFAQLLPQGRSTPFYHFCHIVDGPTGARVGETWYIVRTHGGKVQFWIDWIWIDPPHRRRGLASQVLRHLEEEAVRLGADRVALHVVADNEGAIALYSKLGYRTTNMRLSKPLSPAPSLETGRAGPDV